jgi:hypothetical protein
MRVIYDHHVATQSGGAAGILYPKLHLRTNSQTSQHKELPTPRKGRLDRRRNAVPAHICASCLGNREGAHGELCRECRGTGRT